MKRINSELTIITCIFFTLSFAYGMENNITLFRIKFEKNRNNLEKLEKYSKQLKQLKEFSPDTQNLLDELNNRILYLQTKKNFTYLDQLPIGFLTDAIYKLQKLQKRLEEVISIPLGINEKELNFINKILIPSITQLGNTECLFSSTHKKEINSFLPLSKKDLQNNFKSFDSSKKNIYGDNILQYAIMRKLPSITIEYLLSCGQSINDTNINKENALHAAAITNNNKALQTLLSYKPEICSDDEIKQFFAIATPTSSSNMICSILLRNEAFQAYKTLCSSSDFSAHINAQNIVGQTALHKACIHNSIDCAKILLAYNALPIIKDNNNKQPVDYLFEQPLTSESIEICKKLLNSYEAEVLASHQHQNTLQKIKKNVPFQLTLSAKKKTLTQKKIKNKNSQILYATIIFEALDNNTLNSSLLKNNLTILDKPNKEGITPLCWSLIKDKHHYCKLLLKHNASSNNPSLINISNTDVMLTPLEHTIFIESFSKSEQMLKLLLEYRADPNLGKMYPLLHCKTSIDDTEGIETLINNNANINLKDFVGKTALHIACQKTKPNSIIKLLSLNADPNMINPCDNKSALDYCYENQNNFFIVLLLTLGATTFGKKIFINNNEITNFSNIKKLIKEATKRIEKYNKNKTSSIKISYDKNDKKGIYLDLPKD